MRHRPEPCTLVAHVSRPASGGRATQASVRSATRAAWRCAVAVLAAFAAGSGCAASLPLADLRDSFTRADSPLRLDVERPPAGGKAQASPLLAVLAEEARRAIAELESSEPRAYFVAYQITDEHSVSIGAAFGGLQQSRADRARTLDVDVRVGSPSFDNTHPARGSDMLVRSISSHPSWQLPQSDDPRMLRRTLWVALDTQYRRAVEEYVKVRANARVRADAGDESGASTDFTREPPLEFLDDPVRLEIDRAEWEARLREYSSLFREHPEIYTSGVYLQARAVTRYLVNTEGSRVQAGRVQAQILVSASTRTADGMDLQRFESVDLSLDPSVPEDAEIRRTIAEVIADVRALRAAPQAEPFVGPAILEGPAAGVFAHEVLGHRLEGHRQKSDDEGQTFAAKVGERVMPAFIDVYDDPTIAAIDGIPLNGHYWVDDEAVRSRRTPLIEDGVLRGFLMSRSPIRDFDRSNGHGRRQAGNPIVARQGNLIVHPTRTVPRERLRALLLEEIRRQEKPYGLRFSIVQGGFTNTSRYGFQAFRVIPVMVYKVYPDGREELVRGVSIDGTPLAALSQIIAASDRADVFNGVCGAESGSVPVSAVSPALLLRRVEISGVQSLRNRAPILSAPLPEPDEPRAPGEAPAETDPTAPDAPPPADEPAPRGDASGELAAPAEVQR